MGEETENHADVEDVLKRGLFESTDIDRLDRVSGLTGCSRSSCAPDYSLST